MIIPGDDKTWKLMVVHFIAATDNQASVMPTPACRIEARAAMGFGTAMVHHDAFITAGHGSSIGLAVLRNWW